MQMKLGDLYKMKRSRIAWAPTSASDYIGTLNENDIVILINCTLYSKYFTLVLSKYGLCYTKIGIFE
jgi:hypothetical protein